MKQKGINLLPSAQWRYSWLAFGLRWLLSYGRYVLIFTELIVILAFLSRFKLDQEMEDLNDQIKTNKIILQSAQPFEKEVQRLVHIQNQIIHNWQKEYLWSSYLQELGRNLPKSIVIKKINGNNNKLAITGSTTNISDLTTFLNNLKNNPAFTNLTVNQISSSLGSTNNTILRFALTLELTGKYVKYK